MSKQEQNGWRLTFKFEEKGNLIDVELVGTRDSILAGFQIATATIGTKLQERIAKVPLPSGLLQDLAQLRLIQESEIKAYVGKFLKIEPAGKVTGLLSSISVIWSD